MAQTNGSGRPEGPARPHSQPSWFLAWRPAPVWVGEEGTQLIRPYLLLAYAPESETVVGSDLRDSEPTALEAIAFVRELILNAAPGHRPVRLLTDEAAWVPDLDRYFNAQGIECAHRPAPFIIQTLIRQLEAHLTGRPARHGLLSIPGNTPKLVHELFSAAQAFRQAAPWRWLPDSEPVEVRFPLAGLPRFAVVMGHGAQTFGLAAYESLRALHEIYNSPDPPEAMEQHSWTSLMFETQFEMAFEDLDAINAHGWPIDGPDAFPVTVKIIPPGDVAPYNASDVSWMAAVLRVLPDFVRHEMMADRGDPIPAGKIYTLASGPLAGETIALRYPVSLSPDIPEIREHLEQVQAEVADFVAEWDWDPGTASQAFAFDMGAFVLAFMQYLEASGVSETTLERHYNNAWWIGCFLCEAADDTAAFTPELFQRKPAFVERYKEHVSAARTAVEAYRRTWRRLGQFARELGARN